MTEESLKCWGDGSLDYFGDHGPDGDEAYVPLILLARESKSQ
jgi:hypothetical protein